MLQIVIGQEELFDERTYTFSKTEGLVVDLEHSLFSLSKWESIYQKPFLTSEERTDEEVKGYLKAMVVTPGIDPEIVLECSQEDIDRIQEYINSSQTATTFRVAPGKQGPSEIITSELIYYWMLTLNIPFECEHWHLNRLFSLIRICNVKNSKPQKMSRHEIAERTRELNARRKAELGTTG